MAGSVGKRSDEGAASCNENTGCGSTITPDRLPERDISDDMAGEVRSVAAKVGVDAAVRAVEVSSAIDDAEARIRLAVPHARFIFVEPDIYRA